MATALLEQAAERDAAKLADAKVAFRQLLGRASDPGPDDAERLDEVTALLWPDTTPEERRIKVAVTLQACREELSAYREILSEDESAALRQRVADAESAARAELRAVLDGLLDAADLQALAALVGPVAQVATPPRINTGSGLLYHPDVRAVNANDRRDAALRTFAEVQFEVRQRGDASGRAEARCEQIRRAHPLAFAAE